MQKFCISFAMILLVFSSRAITQERITMDLDSLVAEALLSNPRLMAARSESAAMRERIGLVSAWDAPQIGAEFFKVPVRSFPDPFRDNMEMDYFIQQKIPFPGTLSAKSSAAENSASISDQNIRALEQKIVRDLKSSYYELYLIQQKIRINDENQDLMKRFVAIAAKQYEVGTGSQPDVLRAQTELSSLVNDGINLRQDKRAAEARINTLINRPTNRELGQVPDIEIETHDLTFARVMPLAEKYRPDLISAHFGVEMNKAELTLSKREYYPEIMARIMYKDMLGTKNDFWSLMIGISVPVAPWSGSRYSSKVEEKELNLEAAQYGYSAISNAVSYEVEDALVRVQTGKNLTLLYRNTVIPQAEQTLQSTISAYQTGKTQFLMLIDAYRTVLNARLQYYVSLKNLMSSRAALEQAVGLPMEQIIKIN
jgi:cobalt-zinc-cadmium efflux system outer membrane protein